MGTKEPKRDTSVSETNNDRDSGGLGRAKAQRSGLVRHSTLLLKFQHVERNNWTKQQNST